MYLLHHYIPKIIFFVEEIFTVSGHFLRVYLKKTGFCGKNLLLYRMRICNFGFNTKYLLISAIKSLFDVLTEKFQIEKRGVIYELV